jgi:hypothetical protein
MTNAERIQLHRLPTQLDLVRRRLEQLDRTPRHERKKYWRHRHAAAVAKHKRLTERAAAFGLADLVTGEVA